MVFLFILIEEKKLMTFLEALYKAKIDEAIIKQVMDVEYSKDPDNPKQDNANFMAAAMHKCEELMDFDKISEVMFHCACCKSGYRLENAKQMAKDHGGKTLAEKVEMLGQLQYMGKPRLNVDGDIETIGIGYMDRCPCWNFGGCTPVNGPMPLSYCLCCAGHFRFHYQKALAVKLKVKKVVSSIINSGGKEPCVFIFRTI
jgi:hypothetical protein